MKEFIIVIMIITIIVLFVIVKNQEVMLDEEMDVNHQMKHVYIQNYLKILEIEGYNAKLDPKDKCVLQEIKKELVERIGDE